MSRCTSVSKLLLSVELPVYLLLVNRELKIAFQEYVITKFDKASPEWETYRKLHNKTANEINLAKKKSKQLNPK